MKRAKEVIDCWFDSGSMPFAQFIIHLKIKNYLNKTTQLNSFQKLLTKQEDGSIHYLQFQLQYLEKHPYENCIVLGHVLDKKGLKCLSHKGNVVDPFEVLGSVKVLMLQGGISIQQVHHGFLQDSQ